MWSAGPPETKSAKSGPVRVTRTKPGAGVLTATTVAERAVNRLRPPARKKGEVVSAGGRARSTLTGVVVSVMMFLLAGATQGTRLKQTTGPGGGGPWVGHPGAATVAAASFVPLSSYAAGDR